MDRQVWRDTVYIDGGGIITMSEITESGFSGAIEVLRIIGERLNYIKKEINSMPGLLVLARMIEEYQQE